MSDFYENLDFSKTYFQKCELFFMRPVFAQKLYKIDGFETFRCEIRNLHEKSVLVQLFLSKSDSFINMFLQNQSFLSSYQPFFIISTLLMMKSETSKSESETGTIRSE